MNKVLPGFQEDLLEYIVSLIDEMTMEERKSMATLKESILPFVMESGYCSNEDEAVQKCQEISQAFGGSGFSKSSDKKFPNGLNKFGNANDDEDDTPALLVAPIKMIDHSGLKSANSKSTYGGALIAGYSVSLDGDGALSTNLPTLSSNLSISSNTKYDAAAIPSTQKQLRKLKKGNEQVKKMLAVEARLREIQAAELRSARLAAIKASRLAGRQALTGVKLDKFSLPHPSGTGDLLTDASLTLTPGRRYGLVGRNGAG
jgi:ABC-type multidrug transport system fused ATPase/permease subunit